jgi:hypothetical protein
MWLGKMSSQDNCHSLSQMDRCQLTISVGRGEGTGGRKALQTDGSNPIKNAIPF